MLVPGRRPLAGRQVPASPLVVEFAERREGPRAQTVAEPPFIKNVTPIASAASCGVAPCWTAAGAWAALQPSHSLRTTMARAMSSLVLASRAPATNAES